MAQGNIVFTQERFRIDCMGIDRMDSAICFYGHSPAPVHKTRQGDQYQQSDQSHIHTRKALGNTFSHPYPPYFKYTTIL